MLGVEGDAHVDVVVVGQEPALAHDAEEGARDDVPVPLLHRQGLGEVVQGGARVVDREVALAVRRRAGRLALSGADQREKRVRVRAEVVPQGLDVAGAGIELGVDARRPHEQVVGAPQVLGQARAPGVEKPLEGLEVGGARAEGEVEEVVGDRLDPWPARGAAPSRPTGTRTWSRPPRTGCAPVGRSTADRSPRTCPRTPRRPLRSGTRVSESGSGSSAASSDLLSTTRLRWLGRTPR